MGDGDGAVVGAGTKEGTVGAAAGAGEEEEEEEVEEDTTGHPRHQD